MVDEGWFKLTRAIGLDSNVWRYLVDANRVEDLYRASRKANVTIVAIPAVLYEAIRMPPSVTRDGIIKAICRRAWRRSMPEAYLEAEDVKAAIRRHRPEWLNNGADLRLWHALRADWAEGTWRRARTDATAFAAILGPADTNGLAVARAEAARLRDFLRTSRATLEAFKPDKLLQTPDHSEPGLDGSPFEAWRGDALNYWAEILLGPKRNASAEWIMPWLEPRIPSKHREAWLGFWLRDIDASEVPREWMRTMMIWAAATRKQSNGTPVDLQISSYLFDFDEFVTADRAFVDVLTKLKPYAPAVYATPHLVPGGPAAVDELLTIIG